MSRYKFMHLLGNLAGCEKAPLREENSPQPLNRRNKESTYRSVEALRHPKGKHTREFFNGPLGPTARENS